MSPASVIDGTGAERIIGHMTDLPAASENLVVHGLGLTVLDQQLFLAEYPAADTKVFAEGCRTQVGGPVPIALAQLRRFGARCRLLSAWANDAVGQEIESDLEGRGIEFEQETCRSAARSGLAQVWVETSTGRRTVASLRPDNEPGAVMAAEFGRGARVLHLDGWGGDAAVEAARAARGQGGLVVLDAGSVKPTTERLLPLVHIVNAPRRFLRDFCGTMDPREGAMRILDREPRLVTVTDGERGAGVYTRDVAEWLPGFPVRAIDTCGAGDVFCGGLIYATATGMGPVAALRFAMGTAAIKVSRAGNREALATRGEVERFVDECG